MWKILTLATMAGTLAALGAPALAQQTKNTAEANFTDVKGKETGRAHLSAGNDGVLFEVEISGLEPRKWMALHIHETGNCDDHAEGHKAAGGHFNPDKRAHGFVAATGPHAGDLPNQYVAEDGVMRAQIYSTMVRLDDAERGIRGRALIVHAGSDDYRTDPAGGAGDRIACAVIE
ncbi:superoxide dismutase family protein [Shinella sp. CPCC 101442]|uniref:superoxide dismutase family protein n=1 Tax=Shinella sp. CPCC 101442 TaxID=2932265 RepID=UPI0021529413|nr:superoxide dismutase family protein [Shinella sp. CPCC 101442]MCR6498804.1 superoxide dismutase family protein [Shinella sp. CPCC 101442]